MRVLVVGAGFTGAAIARTLAENNISVDIIDRRDHIGGNTYDFLNSFGIRVHKYGPHIFHTNNFKVIQWLKRFGTWLPYFHRVQAALPDGAFVPFPPNHETITKVLPEKIQETFYIPYTEKMWNLPFSQVSKKTLDRTRPKIRDTDLYFPRDKIQVMPKYGYTKLFENILDHSMIKLNLTTAFDKNFEKDYTVCFNSMPIDEYYEHCYGELPYRSIRFTDINLPMTKLFSVSVVNFTHTGDQTRIVEWKNFPAHGDNPHWTTLTYETPCDPTQNNNEKYYPVLDSSGKNRALYKKYADIPNLKTQFVGRCGNYAYIDMDQAIAHGLAVAKRFIKRQA